LRPRRQQVAFRHGDLRLVVEASRLAVCRAARALLPQVTSVRVSLLQAATVPVMAQASSGMPAAASARPVA